MKELSEIRQELDEIDRQLVHLFEQRMNLSLAVAEYKKSKGMPVLDASREQAVLDTRAAMLVDSKWEQSLRTFYTDLMRISRAAQEAFLQEDEKA